MDNQHISLENIFRELELKHLIRVKELLLKRKFRRIKDAYQEKTYSLDSIVALNRRIAELREQVLA